MEFFLRVVEVCPVDHQEPEPMCSPDRLSTWCVLRSFYWHQLFSGVIPIHLAAMCVLSSYHESERIIHRLFSDLHKLRC